MHSKEFDYNEMKGLNKYMSDKINKWVKCKCGRRVLNVFKEKDRRGALIVTKINIFCVVTWIVFVSGFTIFTIIN